METIYSRLRTWRFQTALSLGVPAFFILSNAHLAGVALARPVTPDELAACPGMGPKKMAQFGTDLLGQVMSALADGLEPGVLPPSGPVPEPEPGALSEDDREQILAVLQQELVRQVVRRSKGRYTAAQVQQALQRTHLPA